MPQIQPESSTFLRSDDELNRESIDETLAKWHVQLIRSVQHSDAYTITIKNALPEFTGAGTLHRRDVESFTFDKIDPEYPGPQRISVHREEIALNDNMQTHLEMFRTSASALRRHTSKLLTVSHKEYLQKLDSVWSRLIHWFTISKLESMNESLCALLGNINTLEEQISAHFYGTALGIRQEYTLQQVVRMVDTLTGEYEGLREELSRICGKSVNDPY